MKKDNQQGGGNAYFQNTKNTELSELQNDLNSMKIDLQKEAMKQIIASMTVGKDVSSLFPHVIKCMKTNNVELKKLIYLYIINYAKAKPEQTLLAVNSFYTDATDKNSPLIRALAVRTMGCIRVQMIVTYLCEILKISLKDTDAYVRKTACICVAKLYGTCPGLVRENGLIDTLHSLLIDPKENAVVVSNAIVSLSEISILSGENELIIKNKALKKVLSSLNEASEWGQVFILDALTLYNPKKDSYAEDIIESVIPRLSHENSAVVMSAVKVILKFLDKIENLENAKNYCKKISNCLMTVMMGTPEIQYVLLRSLHAIVQKRPFLLDKEYKYFFIKYNDPIYIKLEKIDILYKLTDIKNYDSIVKELKSYALMEFDVELVKKAIRYIGYICYKFDKSLNECVDSIKEILDHNQNNDYTIGEGLIVMRDVLRKYKNESKPLELLKKINSDLVKAAIEPDAKCAILYIIGEFCSKIQGSTDMVKGFVEGFSEEIDCVKLQILNSSIKNYLIKQDEAEDLIKDILHKAGEETESPDVRDRAYIYWRLLENNPDLAKEMIFGEKPAFEYEEENIIQVSAVDDIINNMTNVSSVYHVQSKSLINKEDLINDPDAISNEETGKEVGEEKEEVEKKEKIEKKEPKIIAPKTNANDLDIFGIGDEGDRGEVDYQQQESSGKDIGKFNMEDIFGVGGQINFGSSGNLPNVSSSTHAGVSNLMDDIFGISSTVNTQSETKPSHNQNDGFEFEFDDSSSSQFDDVISNISSLFGNTSFFSLPPKLIQSANKNGAKGNKGITIYSSILRDVSSQLQLGLIIKNSSSSALSNISIKINPNSYGLSEQGGSVNNIIQKGETSKILIPLIVSTNKENGIEPSTNYSLPIEITTSYDKYLVNSPIILTSLFTNSGKISDQNEFKKFFSETKSNKLSFMKGNIKIDFQNENEMKKFFEDNNIFFVCKNSKSDPVNYYFSASVLDKFKIVFEFCFDKKVGGLSVGVLSYIHKINPIAKEGLEYLLG